MFICNQSIPSPLGRVQNSIDDYRQGNYSRSRSADLCLCDLNITSSLADAILQLVDLRQQGLRQAKIDDERDCVNTSKCKQSQGIVWNMATISGCYGESCGHLTTSLLESGAIRQLSIKSNRWNRESSNVTLSLASFLSCNATHSLERLFLADAFIPSKLSSLLADAIMVTRSLTSVHLNDQTMRAFPSDLNNPEEEKYGDSANARAATSKLVHSIVISPSIRDITLDLTFSDGADGLVCKVLQQLASNRIKQLWSNMNLRLVVSGRLFYKTRNRPFLVPEDRHTAFQAFVKLLHKIHAQNITLCLLAIQDERMILRYQPTWSKFWQAAFRGNKVVEALYVPHLVKTPATSHQLCGNKDGRWRLAPECVPTAIYPHVMARVNRTDLEDAHSRADAIQHTLVHVPHLTMPVE